MVKVKNDLTGMVFGRLTVLEQAEDYVRPSNGQHEARWLCECSCKNHTRKIIKGADLVKKRTSSCGCMKSEKISICNKKYNNYSELLHDEYGDYYIGYTSNTNKEFYIDADDFNKIKDYCWYENFPKNNFSVLIARDQNTNKPIKMHILLGFKSYDHVDRNELNNRKYNLRPATTGENSYNRNKRSDNTSGYIGVSWSKEKQKWIAQIQYHNHNYNLGGYYDIQDAIIARLQAELKYFGPDFAPQRHLFSKYNITNERE